MSGYQGNGLVLIPAVSAASNDLGAFAGLPPAALQQVLTDAQTALGNLITGQQVVTLSYGEGTGQKSTTFARTNEAALRRLISELQIALGIRRRRRAIRVM